MRRTLLVLTIALIGGAVSARGATALTAPSGSPGSGAASVNSDFDGDGHSDLAVGAPFEGVGDADAAGVVHVIYGSASGLASAASQLWNQETASGSVGEAEPGDFFGFNLAVGDFDGDAYADLAIGALGEDLAPTKIDAGVVHVLYGSPSGLTADHAQTWSQDTRGIKDRAEGGDEFGGGLASGDFDGDGFADLSIGARSEGYGEVENGGGLHILYGTGRGLSAAGSQFWNQDTPGIDEEINPDDLFGVFLATGDMDADGHDDLAVGIIGEDIGQPGDPGSVADAGAAAVLYGSGDGITADGSQLWTQDSPDVSGVAEDADLLGGVGTGDFDGDGYADLAVDAFNERIGAADGAGSVNVLYGSASGISSGGNDFWTQNSPGVADTAEAEDRFSGPASGDFNGDGYDDLAIGAQGEDGFTGIVHVLPGSPFGLTATGSQVWGQDTTGVLGVAEPGEAFATAAAVGDFGGGPHDDLAVGVREGIGSAGLAGAVNVLYGSGGGLATTGNQFWTQNSPGIEDAAEPGDFFGIPISAR